MVARSTVLNDQTYIIGDALPPVAGEKQRQSTSDTEMPSLLMGALDQFDVLRGFKYQVWLAIHPETIKFLSLHPVTAGPSSCAFLL